MRGPDRGDPGAEAQSPSGLPPACPPGRPRRWPEASEPDGTAVPSSRCLPPPGFAPGARAVLHRPSRASRKTGSRVRHPSGTGTARTAGSGRRRGAPGGHRTSHRGRPPSVPTSAARSRLPVVDLGPESAGYASCRQCDDLPPRRGCAAADTLAIRLLLSATRCSRAARRARTSRMPTAQKTKITGRICARCL